MSETASAELGAGLPTTRPATASRKARRPAGGQRGVTRYTLDLEAEQHRYLRMYAVTHSLNASVVMRTLLYLMEAGNELPAGTTLSELVLDEVFAEDVTPAAAADVLDDEGDED